MRSLYPWPLLPTDIDSRATRSLSLQLAIQEWISTFDCLRALEKNRPEPHALADAIQKILLSSMECPFSTKPGTLDKLCFHLHKLLANSTLTGKSAKLSPTDALLDQMQNAILDFRGQINAWKYAASSPASISSAVQTLCATLRGKLMEFFDALFPFFEEARQDENVLFFLIERKAEINHILRASRPTTLEHIFSRLYPTGPTYLHTILQEGYTKRGFSEFYAQHKTLIESIAWLTDQCSIPMNTSS